MSTPSGEIRRFGSCDVFISHIHEEAPLAEALKHVLKSCLPGSMVWASSADIATGEQWAKELNEAMEEAKLILVLCSKRSIRAAWVNFEAGAGWGKEVKVAPLCHGDLGLADLTSPLNGFQGHQLATADDLRRLVVALEGTPPADLGAAWAAIDEASAAIDYVPRAQRPLSSPTAARGVLVDLAHGQAAWPQLRRGTVFSWPTDGVAALTDGLDVEIGTIAAADQVRAADLAAWHGAVLALPFHQRLSEGSIEQIVAWVRAGGRLALLGFELGDPHHEANLNDLASRFALRFNCDILAPPGWKGSAKPYRVDIPIAPSSDHVLFEGVEALVWRNVQTLAREPGTEPLLTTHEHPVATPTPDSVGFAGGALTMPAPAFEFDTKEGLIVVEATRYLTGEGRVVAIGTWELLSDNLDTEGNRRFAANLLRWLTDGPPPRVSRP